MPGVPSGRGCEACRTQKKKCDLQQPSCSRCTRLQIHCVGPGLRRFKFAKPATVPSGKMSSFQHPRPGITPKQLARSSSNLIPCTPNNQMSSLAAAFVQTIKPTTNDERYNLAWSYGPFLNHIPSRLGTNKALDAAVAALTEAHSNLCTRSGVTTSALVKYSFAMTQLRITLDDPAIACATETLGAAMILSICQSFLGNEGNYAALTHTAGMARILKYRGRFHDPNDQFESELLLTLRGPVVVEALWNDAIDFTDSEWEALVSNHLDSGSRPESRIVRCLSRLPMFLRRGRDSRNRVGLVQDVTAVYQTVQLARKELRDRVAMVDQRLLDGELGMKKPLIQAQFNLHRLYALCLAVTIILSCILSSLSPHYAGIKEELHTAVLETLSLAQVLQRYRPLGAATTPLCLAVAWIGTEDLTLRSTIESKIKDSMRDFPGLEDADTLVASLEALERRFKIYECDINLC